jgi:Double zinc ribbon
VLESIKEFIEFLAEDLAQIGATLAPFLLAGLLGLYVLWLVIGYLRVSQAGLEPRPQPVVPLLPPPDPDAPEPASAGPAALQRPRGVPYCQFDGLLYPVGAPFCTACERDLLIDCANCGATVPASEAFCYRCGTPTGVAEPSKTG